MLLQVEYRFAFVLFLAAKTAEGAGNSVFFQIKENKFFSFGEESLLWSGTGSLLSCSVLCMRQASCRSANFLEKAGLCYLLRDEKMQTRSATGRLLERDGSFYLKKVFHVDFFLHVIVFGWQLAIILALSRPRKPLLDLSHQREDFSQQNWLLFPSFQETKTLKNLISVKKKIKKKTRAFNS